MEAEIIAIIQIYRTVLGTDKHKTTIWIVTRKRQLSKLLRINIILYLTFTPIYILRQNFTRLRQLPVRRLQRWQRLKRIKIRLQQIHIIQCITINMLHIYRFIRLCLRCLRTITLLTGSVVSIHLYGYISYNN